MEVNSRTLTNFQAPTYFQICEAVISHENKLKLNNPKLCNEPGGNSKKALKIFPGKWEYKGEGWFWHCLFPRLKDYCNDEAFA